MLRTIITLLVPFLAPFVCYAVWTWFNNRKKEREEAGLALDRWQTYPWAYLFIVGSVLAIAALLIMFVLSDPPQEGLWIGPAVIDGVVVPGHYEPIPEPADPD